MNITATLLAQIAAFLILIWMVNKLLSKPLGEVLEKRRNQIRDGLAAAKKGKQILSEAEAQGQDIARQSHVKGEQIIANAHERATVIVDEARTIAGKEAVRIKATAQEGIDRQQAAVREKLRLQVAELAVAGAEQILRREVDMEDHKDALKVLQEQV